MNKLIATLAAALAATLSAGAFAQNAAPEQRAAMKEKWQSMTPEQKAALKEKWQSMTPEQKAEAKKRMAERRQHNADKAAPAASAVK